MSLQIQHLRNEKADISYSKHAISCFKMPKSHVILVLQVQLYSNMLRHNMLLFDKRRHISHIQYNSITFTFPFFRASTPQHDPTIIKDVLRLLTYHSVQVLLCDVTNGHWSYSSLALLLYGNYIL